MRNLDISVLRSFVAVAQAGGVTRAAGFLNLTQSAVSMQLKRLEETMGLDLLDRSNRRIALTAAGEQLLGYARRMVEMNDEMFSRLTDQAFEGEVTLGVPHDIVYPVVPQVLQRFNAEYPRVKVRLTSLYTSGLKRMFDRGECDLILTTEPEVGEGGETLKELPLRWIGAPGGQAWKQRPLPLANCLVCSFRITAMDRLTEAEIAWEQAVESESDRTVEATVAADLAITVMLEGTHAAQLEQICPGPALPDLGTQKINLYGGTSANGGFVGHLKEMIRQGYRAM
ncbi:LysR family transcriptional regulator [Psychromarinibacter sp. C21-152]|uniref:LysR family transcriptional regulator n=1 Tax=Psychromarinibacter sediminicola TaxID=3033385 RepID=A0AAE3T8U7_9RHOB|nr:LysR family transcriptional regulator [Psychromarinibacter sediminicola]MDF0599875.1 LysR family transcriptional regulator [Psychromarinibacter sediminicola]